MDRTILNRTIMESHKAEEKELSAIIHYKIEALTQINEPSDDFKLIFAKDIFLKSNPKAFYTIMHFLFVSLDPNEFKKRFYWPIIDKKSEAIFRSSTVDYLNYLNKKHNLKWNPIKNYLLLMPGGFKFLMFLNDFIDFIAGELVKQREKYLSEKMGLETIDINTFNFNKIKQQRIYLRKNSLQYSESLENNTKKFKKSIDFLYNEFEKISNFIKIPSSVLMDRTFLEKFSEFGENLIKENITKKVDEILKSESNIVTIEENIKKYQLHKSEIKFDRKELLTSVDNIQKKSSNIFGNLLCGTNLNLEELVNIFDNILPEIKNILSTLEPNLLDIIKYEENELTMINNDFIKLDNDINNYSKLLNDEIKENETANITKTPMRFKYNVQNDLHTKLINTPPIINFENNVIDNYDIIKRLPLMDEYYLNDISTIDAPGSSSSCDRFSFANNQNTLLLVKTPKKNFTNRNNSTINRPKIMDPSLLLRSLKKSKRLHNISGNISNGNLSKLSMKWKEEECIQTNEKDQLFDLNTTNHSKIITTVRNNRISDCTKKLFLESPSKIFKSIESPKNVTVQQIQNSLDLDLSKLSTSPSGRLESLIKMNQNDMQKIFLTLDQNNSLDPLKLNSLPSGPEKSVFQDNLTNLPKLLLNDCTLEEVLENDDFNQNLLNISDTILNDITI